MVKSRYWRFIKNIMGQIITFSKSSVLGSPQDLSNDAFFGLRHSFNGVYTSLVTRQVKQRNKQVAWS
jgi:hypothetical protein